MSLPGNISEGGRRLGVVMGVICAIPMTAVGAGAGSLIMQAADLGDVALLGMVIGGFIGLNLGYWAGSGIVRALTWVVRGFVGD